MREAYNKHSKREDADLYSAMDEVQKNAVENFPLPDGYVYERWKKIPYDRIHQWHIQNGNPENEVAHLLKKNDKSGKYASIEPDAGMIVAVKKDFGGNIIEWIPLLSAEAKHQESSVGNAIERVFKNYNAHKEIFKDVDIFPYICFGQGSGLSTSFEQNKLIAGMGNDVNMKVNVYDKTYSLETTKSNSIIKDKLKSSVEHKNGNFFVREKSWTKPEMVEILNEAMSQVYDYYGWSK